MSKVEGVVINESRKVDLRYCDGCGELIETGYRTEKQHYHCGVCDRDFCIPCYGDHKTQVHEEVYMIPCDHCREAIKRHPEHIARLIEIKAEEEKLRQESWGIEKKLGRSSRAMFRSVKPKEN